MNKRRCLMLCVVGLLVGCAGPEAFSEKRSFQRQPRHCHGGGSDEGGCSPEVRFSPDGTVSYIVLDTLADGTYRLRPEVTASNNVKVTIECDDADWCPFVMDGDSLRGSDGSLWISTPAKP